MSEILEAPEVAGVVRLLGGDDAMREGLSTPAGAHDFITRGLSGGSLLHLVAVLPALATAAALPNTLGMTLRTLQRVRKTGGEEPLSLEQSGRLFRTAAIMAKAVEVLGSDEEAERFLEAPALALDGKRPIDLLATPVGAEMVERHLVRLDYGVYT